MSMKNSLLAVAALASLAACGSATTTPGPTPAATITVTATSTPTPVGPPADSSGLLIGYGSLGAAGAGMTPAQALETGLFDVPTPGPEGCPQRTLEFKPKYVGVGVTAFENRRIDALIVGKAGPRTAQGIQIGSEESALKAAYGAALKSAIPTYYGRSYEVHQDGGYINFLVGQNEQGKQTTKVTHIVVTLGGPFDFATDGC